MEKLTKKRKKIKKLNAEKFKFNQKTANKFSKKLIKKITKHEKMLKDIFDEDRVLYEFQKPFYSVKSCYIIDFAFKSYFGQKIAIEIDGKSHESEKAKAYDDKRTRILQKYGYDLIRFKNEQIEKEIDTVINIIYSKHPVFY